MLGIAAFFCFWIPSKNEDNIKKFGEVPAWNFLKGIRNLKK